MSSSRHASQLSRTWQIFKVNKSQGKRQISKQFWIYGCEDASLQVKLLNEHEAEKQKQLKKLDAIVPVN